MKALLGVIVSLPVLLVSCLPTSLDVGSGYLTGFRTMTPTNEKQPLAHQRGYWDGDHVPGPALIRLNRDEQKAYFYKGQELVGVSPISTGKTTHTTPAGRYKITQKSEDHESSLYGVIRDRATGEIVNDDADTRKDRPGPGQVFEAAPMPYFMRFNGGIGMHVGHLPGYAASHGCVRMPKEMAVKFFEAAKVGTPVIVE
ncbi:MAG: L,D-transpeptidase family protein [Akkermansiaceae bacterium]